MASGYKHREGHFHDHAKHNWKVLSERARGKREKRGKRRRRSEERRGKLVFPEHSSLVHIPARVHPGMEINVCMFAHFNGRGKFFS